MAALSSAVCASSSAHPVMAARRLQPLNLERDKGTDDSRGRGCLMIGGRQDTKVMVLCVDCIAHW